MQPLRPPLTMHSSTQPLKPDPPTCSVYIWISSAYTSSCCVPFLRSSLPSSRWHDLARGAGRGGAGRAGAGARAELETGGGGTGPVRARPRARW
jgi:hypothetical protein